MFEHGLFNKFGPSLGLFVRKKNVATQLQNDISVGEVVRDSFGNVVDRVGNFQLKVQFLNYLVVVVDQVAVLVEKHLVPLLETLEGHHSLLRPALVGPIDEVLPLKVLSDVRCPGQALRKEGPAFLVDVAIIGCCNACDGERQKSVLVGWELSDDVLHSHPFENSEHECQCREVELLNLLLNIAFKRALVSSHH